MLNRQDAHAHAHAHANAHMKCNIIAKKELTSKLLVECALKAHACQERFKHKCNHHIEHHRLNSETHTCTHTDGPRQQVMRKHAA